MKTIYCFMLFFPLLSMEIDLMMEYVPEKEQSKPSVMNDFELFKQRNQQLASATGFQSYGRKHYITHKKSVESINYHNPKDVVSLFQSSCDVKHWWHKLRKMIQQEDLPQYEASLLVPSQNKKCLTYQVPIRENIVINHKVLQDVLIGVVKGLDQEPEKWIHEGFRLSSLKEWGRMSYEKYYQIPNNYKLRHEDRALITQGYAVAYATHIVAIDSDYLQGLEHIVFEKPLISGAISNDGQYVALGTKRQVFLLSCKDHTLKKIWEKPLTTEEVNQLSGKTNWVSSQQYIQAVDFNAHSTEIYIREKNNEQDLFHCIPLKNKKEDTVS